MSTDVPLPPIMDATRRQKVFSHKGLPNDNTRLALLGAALLVAMATVYKLYQFPHSATGEVTTERSKLVNKDAVSSYALHYDLPRDLQARENVDQVRKTTSAQATLFEAYVAAVFIQSEFDFSLVKNWLFALWDLKAQQ
ncbi:hypothetical protein CALCODRAFT_557621 [Calocera cornea HHB12733]|uniref:RNase III domain-containing protein n=1 Tax=Calocera cornea HHB12733 TaxID=1353952 RepID=A0A165DPK4_9BASI|nr:hypothetical protein CALCODRAFT_557621 [Calocera cornea HHB12733]